MSSTSWFKRSSAFAALLWLACGPASPPPPEPVAEPTARPEEFSPDRAWGHLVALAGIGPRRTGTAGAERAREYLRGELSSQGLTVEEQRAQVDRGGERIETVNLVARIPGDFPDAILLVAPYDSPPGDTGSAGVDAGASGAALLLELTRALGVRRSPYAVWIALVEGDALAASGAVPRSEVGSGALARALVSQGLLDRIRLAVYFDRVSRADLRIARDLRSSRSAREEFWTVARRLGYAAVFPPDAPFESVDGGHRALLDAGLRRTLAISGRGIEAGDGATEAASAPPDDLEHSSRESLASVGSVSQGALAVIGARLAKIDRFVKSPIPAAHEAPVAPAPEEAPPPEAAPPVPAPDEAPPRAESVAPQSSGDEGSGAQTDGSR